MPRAIKLIKLDIAEAEKRVRKLNEELHAAQCDAAGIHVGDVVVDENGTEWLVHIITFWTFCNDNEPRMEVRKRCKGGSWSKATQYFYGKKWKRKEVAAT